MILGDGRTLFFIRHGETDWNAAGRLQGVRDVALNLRGRAQAHSVAHTLKAFFASTASDGQGDGQKVLPIIESLPMVSSPLLRATETMEIMRQTLGLPAHGYGADPRLREIGFGAWEGKTWRELARQDPALSRERRQNPWHFAPPGGESYADVAARVGAALEDCSCPLVMVAHGGIGRVLMALLCAHAQDKILDIEIEQGRLYVFVDGAVRVF